SNGQGVTFDNQGSGTWYGIILTSAAVATFNTATIAHANYGILHEATGTTQIANVTTQNNTYGFYVSAGTPAIDAAIVTANSYGVYVTGGSATLTNMLAYSNTTAGVYVYPSTGAGTTTISNATIN